MAVLDDDALVAHVVATRDPAAFGELVRRHERRILGLLRRLSGDRAASEDLAQETFLLAFRHLADYRRDGGLGGWLARIAVRTWLSARRRCREDLDDDVVDVAVSPEVDAPLDLERGLAQLRPAQRGALVLSLGFGFTHDEIADALELPLGTVKTYIARGRDALRAWLSEGPE